MSPHIMSWNALLKITVYDPKFTLLYQGLPLYYPFLGPRASLVSESSVLSPAPAQYSLTLPLQNSNLQIQTLYGHWEDIRKHRSTDTNIALDHDSWDNDKYHGNILAANQNLNLDLTF